MGSIIRRILIVEPLVIFFILYVIWFDVPDRFWGLVLLLPLLALRLVAYRRPVAATPLNPFLLALLVLGVINIYTAPFRYAPATLEVAALGWQITLPYLWVTLTRPVVGMALLFGMVDHARRFRMNGIVTATVCLALFVAFWALVATQWNSKSASLRFITDNLPRMLHTNFATGGFNANELSGALAYLTPLCAGLMLYRWRWRAVQVGAGVAFALLLFALFLGQGRLAIIGVIVGLGAVIFLLIPNGRRRYVALALLVGFIILEIIVAFNIFAPAQATALRERDETSFGRRFLMWEAAIDATLDYPLTGVGMNMFRARHVRAVYPVESYENRVLPHVHSEYFQIATDLGLPGVVVFFGIYGVTIRMLWRIWRRGSEAERVIAISAGAGLLAHGIFGVGDAITLWDRFAFLFWWLIGLITSQYTLLAAPAPEADVVEQREMATVNI